ncbi:MAG TPA: hypothetical protein V6D26_13065, partial [Stenomitos sp.]
SQQLDRVEELLVELLAIQVNQRQSAQLERRIRKNSPSHQANLIGRLIRRKLKQSVKPDYQNIVQEFIVLMSC